MEGTTDQPFFPGGPIPAGLSGRYFYGFEEERRAFIEATSRRGPARIALAGGRRSGKTSFVLACAADLPQKRAHLDCDKIWPATTASFYALLLDALGIPAPSSPLAGPPASVFPSFPIPRKEPRQLLVIENLEGLAEIDQALLDELSLLTVRLPHPVVVTGEGDVVRRHAEVAIGLHPFSQATATEFLRRRFASGGLEVEDAALAVLFEFSQGSPDALQRLGHSAWANAIRHGQRRIGVADVDKAVAAVVARLPTDAVKPWAQVRGVMRDIFIALCLHDLSSPTAVARRLAIEPKNAVVLLSRLVDQHRLVDRVDRGTYRVRDPLLKHYVRMEWGSPILR